MHGISKKEALLNPTPAIAALRLKGFLEGLTEVHTPVGFNCRGDAQYLSRFCSKWELTYEWKRKIRPDWIDLIKLGDGLPIKNKKLETMCEHFGIHYDFHDALADARATKDLHGHLAVLNKQKQKEFPINDPFEKRLQYLTDEYVTIDPGGFITIRQKAIQNPDILKVVLDEIAERFF